MHSLAGHPLGFAGVGRGAGTCSIGNTRERHDMSMIRNTIGAQKALACFFCTVSRVKLMK